SAPILKTEDIPLANCGVYINEMQDLEIKVFPNPSTNYIDVYWNMANSGDINISIYDITGKLMSDDYKSAVEVGVILLNYDVSYYTSGVYFIHVEANNQTSTIPFIRL
ncbi:MAG: T9SS type A sorting domain-containing protein, partial [Chitinophagales bacterium]